MLSRLVNLLLPYIPVTLRIARSMVVDPAQWTVILPDRVVHEKIGSVVFTPTPMLIVTQHGNWRPTQFNQIVLALAVRWRRTTYPMRLTGRAIHTLTGEGV
jgi:hypothetical protein